MLCMLHAVKQMLQCSALMCDFVPCSMQHCSIRLVVPLVLLRSKYIIFMHCLGNDKLDSLEHFHLYFTQRYPLFCIDEDTSVTFMRTIPWVFNFFVWASKFAFDYLDAAERLRRFVEILEHIE